MRADLYVAGFLSKTLSSAVRAFCVASEFCEENSNVKLIFFGFEKLKKSLQTTPTFVAWTFEVPQQTFLLQYLLAARAPADSTTPAHLYLDGALIIPGSYPIDQVPSFDDASASGGTWKSRARASCVP